MRSTGTCHIKEAHCFRLELAGCVNKILSAGRSNGDNIVSTTQQFNFKQGLYVIDRMMTARSVRTHFHYIIIIIICVSVMQGVISKGVKRRNILVIGCRFNSHVGQ